MNDTLHGLLRAALAAVLLLTGCGRKTPEEEPGRDARTTPQPTQTLTRDRLAPPARPGRPPAAAAVAEPQETPAVEEGLAGHISVTAILITGGEARAGLMDEQSGQAGFVRVGQTFAGYRVDAIDPSRGTVMLSNEAGSRERTLGRDVPVPAAVLQAVQPTPAGERAWPEENLPALHEVELFEPTEDEISRGIDPNRPATWPADYRGPGIERALQGALETEP